MYVLAWFRSWRSTVLLGFGVVDGLMIPKPHGIAVGVLTDEHS